MSSSVISCIQLAISCKKLVQLAILAVAVFIRFWKVLAVACLAVRFCTITVGHSGHRLQKLLKRHVSTFLEILYRTIVFLNVFVEENYQNFQKHARHNSSSRQNFQKNIAKIKNPTQVMITQKVSTKSNIEKCLKTASSFCNVFLKSR